MYTVASIVRYWHGSPHNAAARCAAVGRDGNTPPEFPTQQKTNFEKWAWC